MARACGRRRPGRGTIENRTGRQLRNVRLLYGDWGYRLGRSEAGGRIEVGDELEPAQREDDRHAGRARRTGCRGEAEASVFVAERASAEELLNLMMFYEAAGGLGFAQLPNRYQAYCDLSRLLELGPGDPGGRRARRPAAGWSMRDSEPGDGERDSAASCIGSCCR